MSFKTSASRNKARTTVETSVREVLRAIKDVKISPAWELVTFANTSPGVIDILALRKSRLTQYRGTSPYDCFNIVLVQVKSGKSPAPFPDEIDRMLRVQKWHNASAIVLATWRNRRLAFFRLVLKGGQRRTWEPILVEEVFGVKAIPRIPRSFRNAREDLGP